MRNMHATLKISACKFDEYNTLSEATYTRLRDIEVKFCIFSQQNTDDIRYKDVTHIALTRDTGKIADNMRLKIDGTDYDILLVYPYGHMTQLFLKEVV